MRSRFTSVPSNCPACGQARGWVTHLGATNTQEKQAMQDTVEALAEEERLRGLYGPKKRKRKTKVITKIEPESKVKAKRKRADAPPPMKRQKALAARLADLDPEPLIPKCRHAKRHHDIGHGKTICLNWLGPIGGTCAAEIYDSEGKA